MSAPTSSPAATSKRPRSSVARFVVVGDVHFTKRPPASRSASYPEEIADLFWQVGSLSDSHGADAVLLVGDLMHSKGNTTHHETASLIEILSGPTPKFAIPGNHDMQGNSLANAQQDQPYAVLASAGVVRDLSDTGVPFSDFDVLVVGVPFCSPASFGSWLATSVANGVARCKAKPSAIVVLTHQEITNDGSVGLNGCTLVNGLMQTHNCPVAILNGHLHIDPAAYLVTDRKLGLCGYFVSTGTLARTSISDSDNAAAFLVDYDIAKPKSTALSVRVLPLKNLPRSEAFVENGLSVSAPTAGLDDFVAALSSEAGGQGVDPLSFVRSIAAARNAPKSVLARAVQLVGEVR